MLSSGATYQVTVTVTQRWTPELFTVCPRGTGNMLSQTVAQAERVSRDKHMIVAVTERIQCIYVIYTVI